MRDPRRLLESAGAGDLERMLLESADATHPTDAQCEALWASLNERLPSIEEAGAGGPPARSPGMGAMGIAKVALLSVAVVTGALALPRAVSRSAPARETASPALAIAPSPPHEPEVVEAEPRTAASVPVETQPAPRPAPVAATAVLDSRAARHARREDGELRSETAQVLRARAALRAGDCKGALSRLDEARALFPEGVLLQEREALGIQALGCAGREAEAADRGGAFLREHPSSPLAGVVRRFVR
jgi:hypothetical protein